MTPNVVAFRARFPEFDPPTAEDPDIQAALEDALQEVPQAAWEGKPDWPRAVMFFAAHILQLGAMAKRSGGAIDTFVRSVGFGDRRVMYGERTTYRSQSYKYGAGEAQLEQTYYGARFLMLRNRNFPAVAVV